jgi:hypothetical protein
MTGQPEPGSRNGEEPGGGRPPNRPYMRYESGESVLERGERAWWRREFERAAGTAAPSPLPLAAILREAGDRRRKRRAIIRGGVLCLVMASLVTGVAGLEEWRDGGTPLVTAPAGQPSGSAPGDPEWPSHFRSQVVRPGEPISAWPGVELRLNEEGLRWEVPGRGTEGAMRVGDSVSGTSRPALVPEEVDLGGASLITGLYYGARRAAYIQVKAGGRRHDAMLLRLGGSDREWGVFAVRIAAAERPGISSDKSAPPGPLQEITMYSVDGRELARLDFPSGI